MTNEKPAPVKKTEDIIPKPECRKCIFRRIMLNRGALSKKKPVQCRLHRD